MLNQRTIPRQIELKWILRESKPKLWLIVHRWLKNRVHPMSHYSAERRKAPNHIIEMPKRMTGSAWQKFNFFCRVRIDSKFSQFSFFFLLYHIDFFARKNMRKNIVSANIVSLKLSTRRWDHKHVKWSSSSAAISIISITLIPMGIDIATSNH